MYSIHDDENPVNGRGQFEAVPEELRQRDQWIPWAWGWSREYGWQKHPVKTSTGESPVNDKDPALWVSFPEAVEAVERFGADGVSFCFSARDMYCGVDLDDCRDPATEEIAEWARKMIEALDSYTEVSPSGTGVKIFLRGVPTLSSKRKSVEVYDRRRMFTTTGWHLEGTPGELRSPQEELVDLCHRVWPEGADGDAGEIPDPVSPELDDSEVLDKARHAKNAERFARLFDEGDLSGHGNDHSSADLALLGMLAFYTQDQVQLDRLFRQSALMREKWDHRHRGDGANYGEMTVEKTLRGRGPEDCWGSGVTSLDDHRPDDGRGLPLVDLGQIVRDGVEPTPLLVSDVLYEGKIHSWWGEAESGKSILTLWASLRAMQQGGSVLYLDMENGWATVGQRLGEMGADPETVSNYFSYCPGDAVTGKDGLRRLYKTMEDKKFTLVIFDSVSGFLGTEGTDENDNSRLSGWMNQTVRPLRDKFGATVILLDHTNKYAKGRGPRGGTAKLNEIDVGYKAIQTEYFDYYRKGKVKLSRINSQGKKVGKDRLGGFTAPYAYFIVGGDGHGNLTCQRQGELEILLDGLNENEQRAVKALKGRELRFGEWKEASSLSDSSFERVTKRLKEKEVVGYDEKYKRYYVAADREEAALEEEDEDE